MSEGWYRIDEDWGRVSRRGMERVSNTRGKEG